MKFYMQVNVITVFAVLAMTGCYSEASAPATQNTVTQAQNVTATATATSEAQSELTKIVFLGDSLTAGYGLPQEQAWPEQVHKRLTATGFKIDIINAGVSGDNTANGLARYDWSVGSADADILVLALGANDFLQGVSPKTTRANLKSIIERAQAGGLTVILAGIASSQSESSNLTSNPYASIYPDLAKEHGLSYFPSMLQGVSDRPDLLQADGLHPTEAGVEVMAERFAQHMRDVLDK